MAGSLEEVLRVGVRLVIVALVAGLLVLLFNPVARSAEVRTPNAHEALLLEPARPLTPEERVQAAQTLLSDDRRRKTGSLAAHVINLGIRAAGQVSPRRVLRGVRDIVRDVRNWGQRSDAEARALALLEAEHRAGTLAESGAELFEKLRVRERQERASVLLEAAERSETKGQHWLARRTANRALKLGADPDDVAELIARVDDAAVEEHGDNPAQSLAIEAWEVRAAAALLRDDFGGAYRVAGESPEAQLVLASSLYLAGARNEGLAAMRSLSHRTDSVGETARTWLADPKLNPVVEFDREAADYRQRRALGWVGGKALSRDGFGLSTSSYDAWRNSLSPMNLVLSAPSRMVRGWEPDATALRAAAEDYLEVLPDGERASEARKWLGELPVDSQSARRASLWDDGVMVLPAPRTDYETRMPNPILLTVGSLGRERFEALGIELGSADAVLIAPLLEGPAVATPLDSRDALTLIAEIAGGLEEEALTAHRDQQTSLVLEALRRLDVGVRNGTVISAEPWLYVDRSVTTASLNHVEDEASTLSGMRERFDSLDLARGREDVKVTHDFRAGVDCPEKTWCVDRARRIDGQFYATFDVDGDMKLGARTSFASTALGFELTATGASASVSIPVTRWLGIDHWIPLSASVGVGLDGVSIGTQPVEDDAESRR